MATIDFIDGARYVLILCVPNGEETKAEVRWDEKQGVDAGTALLMIDSAKTVLTQQIEMERLESARARLLAPLAVPVQKNGKSLAPVPASS